VRVVRWLSKSEQDEIAGLHLYEANHPINPLLKKPRQMSNATKTQLTQEWALIKGSARDSVRDAISSSIRSSAWNRARNSVWDSVMGSIYHPAYSVVWDAVRNSVIDSVGESAWNSAATRNSVWNWARNSIRASVWAYTSGLFPQIKKWHYTDISDPWRPLLHLWYAGYVPSFDGKVWRLHCGPKADVCFEMNERGIIK